MNAAQAKAFVYNQNPARVVFEVDAIERASDEVERLGCQRALVLSTPEQRALADTVAARLSGRCAGVFDRAQMHVPAETVEAALAVVSQTGADGVVSVGGGSTTGLGKIIALKLGLPVLSIATTYAGSEMTPLYGMTQGGEKITGRDARVLPKTVIYDPALTLDLPVAISISSGVNAIAHAAEGLYAPDANPIVSLLAVEGIGALARGLAKLREDPRNLTLRSECLYGAWLCGSVLGSVGMGIHHKICHVLGGSFSLPHAETHTIVLPHALAYNVAHAPQAMERISIAIGGSGVAQRAPEELFELLRRLGAPLALSAIGMQEHELDRAARLIAERPYPNPRSLDQARIRKLLDDACAGRPPHIDDHTRV